MAELTHCERKKDSCGRFGKESIKNLWSAAKGSSKGITAGKAGAIQKIQKEGAKSKIVEQNQCYFENTRKKGGRGPLGPSPKSAYGKLQFS